jgi:hypothetical protein
VESMASLCNDKSVSSVCPRNLGTDRLGTKSYLIETMVELLGSQVLAGKCEFALTAVPIANCCAPALQGPPLNPLDK